MLEAADRVGGKLSSVRVGRPRARGRRRLLRGPQALGGRALPELGLGRLVAPGATGAYLWTDAGLVRFPKDAAVRHPRRRRRRAAVAGAVARPGVGAPCETSCAAGGGTGRTRPSGSCCAAASATRPPTSRSRRCWPGCSPATSIGCPPRRPSPSSSRGSTGQGSLIRGSQAAHRAAPADAEAGPMFLKPRGGHGDAHRGLADRPGDGPHRSRTGRARPAGLRGARRRGERLPADAVVVATPAFAAAGLLGGSRRPAAAELARRSRTPRPRGRPARVPGGHAARRCRTGTGFVVPRGPRADDRRARGSRSKWPREDFGARAVVRCYVGARRRRRRRSTHPDEDLVGRVRAAPGARPGGAARPSRAHAASSAGTASMPQYEVGHLERVARIRDPGCRRVSS